MHALRTVTVSEEHTELSLISNVSFLQWALLGSYSVGRFIYKGKFVYS